MLGLRKKCGCSTLNWPLCFHEIIPFVDAEQATFSTFSFFIVFSPHVRSVLLVRAATAVERQSTGLQPIIRKEKGMNRKASFHLEMPKYRHIMDAEAGRRGDINWPAAGDAVLWSYSDHAGWWQIDITQPPLFPCSCKRARTNRSLNVLVAADAQTCK